MTTLTPTTSARRPHRRPRRQGSASDSATPAAAALKGRSPGVFMASVLLIAAAAVAGSAVTCWHSWNEERRADRSRRAAEARLLETWERRHAEAGARRSELLRTREAVAQLGPAAPPGRESR